MSTIDFSMHADLPAPAAHHFVHDEGQRGVAPVPYTVEDCGWPTAARTAVSPRGPPTLDSDASMMLALRASLEVIFDRLRSEARFVPFLELDR